MKKLGKVLAVILIITAIVTALWLALLLIGVGGSFIDDIMVIPVGDFSVLDIVIWTLLGAFTSVALVRMFGALKWGILFLLNPLIAAAWYAMETTTADPSWDSLVAFIILAATLLLLVNALLLAAKLLTQPRQAKRLPTQIRRVAN